MDDLRRKYAQADGIAKSVSLASQEVIIPAHNELRYAGYHLLQAIDEKGNLSNQRHLARAEAHCERALYDAAEAGIVVSMERLNSWFRKFSSIPISETLSNVGEIRGAIRRTRQLLSKETSGRPAACALVTAYKELRHACEDFENFEPDLYASRNKRRILIASLLVGIAAIGAPITIYFLG